MAGKHLSEDEIKYTISADTSNAQKELHQLGKSTAALRREEKARRSAMIELESTGQKNSEQYRKLKQECRDYTRQIADNEEKMRKLRSTLDVSAMTMNQLRKYAKELSSELNNTSKAASPKQYAELESRLQGVNMRIEELRNGTVQLRQHFLSMESFNIMAGNIMTKLAELAGNTLRKFIGFVSESIAKSVELAESADGITHAFNQIGSQDYLQSLRNATKGTVSDIELMKAAVKAKDFRIPLEDLGKYLSFAQLKAQQTGQSLDYMVDSIVTGLGRKSPMILDNLGLSAAEISEKTKQTGDFMKAVASIVENNLSQAGETYVSATDRAARRTVELENAQRSLGEVLLPLQEKFSDVYGQIQIGAINAIKYLVQHRDTLLFLTKSVALLTAAYLAYIAGQKLSYVWSLREVAVSKLKAAAQAIENTMLELSVLRHAVLNKTMTTSIALQKAFNIVLKLSPWGLVLGGITLVVGALLLFNKRTEESSKKTKELIETEKEYKKVRTDARAELTEDLAVLQTFKGSKQQELNLVQKMNDKYGESMGYYKSVKDWYNTLIRNSSLYCEQMVLEARIRNLANKAAEQREKAEPLRKIHLKQKKKLPFDSDVKNEGYQVQDLGKSLSDAYGNMIKEAESTENTIKELVRKSTEIQKKMHQGGTASPTKDDKKKTSSKSTAHTTDPDDIASKDFAQDRAKDLETAKRGYDDDLNALELALAEKRLTQEQYNAYISALNIQHQNQLLAIEQEYQQRSKNVAIKDGAKRKQLQEQQDKAVADQQQAATNAYIEGEKQYYDALDKLKSTAPGMPQTLQQERDAKLLILDGYYKASLQLAGEDGERQKQVTASYEAAKAAIVADYTRKSEEDRAQIRQQYGLSTLEEQLAAERKKLLDEFNAGRMSQEDYNLSLEKIEQDAEQHRMQIRQQYGLVSQKELYDAELLQLKQHLQNKELSESEYEEAVKNLKISKMKEAFDYYANLSGGAIQALLQAEEANVDAKYDAEIEAAKNAGKDTTELEKKKANEKLKIQKKYADVDFAIKASQIIADTAVAIMRAYKDLPLPSAIAASALLGITGAAQLAAANAERQRVKKMSLSGGSSGTGGSRVATGLETGGSINVEREQDGRMFNAVYDPSKRGFVSRPTVIVGEGPVGRSREWVASNAAVENPTVAPLVDIIDRAQRAGTIRTLDMNKWLLQNMQGREAGGRISTVPRLEVQSVARASYKDTLIERLTTVLDRISKDGIPSDVLLDDIERKQKLRDRARKFGSKE